MVQIPGADAPEDELVQLTDGQGESESDARLPGEDFRASISNRDWTVETLVSQMRKGRIDLDPDFQRRNAWLANRKSKLIESIFIGFPLPQIVLAEKPGQTDHYFVLDGKQRLLALRQFFKDEDDPRDADFDALRLTSLESLRDLNGWDFSKIERERPDLASRLENTSIRTVLLSDWNSEDLLLSLFLRLNTGSVQLSPQELRQALVPGPFMSWLDRHSGQSAALHSLLGNTKPDRRMADTELSLRFISFVLGVETYAGNLKRFLDETSKQLNRQWQSGEDVRVRSAFEGFESAIEFGLDLLGSDCLGHKWNGVKFERFLNRALLDAQLHSFYFEEVRAALQGKGPKLAEVFMRACETNEDFMKSISSTTKTREAFLTRHGVWRGLVEEVAGASYDLPSALRS